MNRQLRLGVVLAALVSMSALSACSGGGLTDSSDGDGPTTVSFAGADKPEGLAPLIEAFEEANPNITIDYQQLPFDQYNNIIAQRVGGKDPSIDVYLADAGTIADLANKGYLVDLSEYRSQVEATSLPAAVAGNVWQDKLWALPLWTSQQYLFYNKDLLDAAGVEYPALDGNARWTWEETVDAAKQAQGAGAEWGLLFDQTDRYYQLQPLPESAGGGSGATGDDLLTVDITNAGWTKAMEWYGSLFADGLAPRGVATDQMGVLFAGGDAAFFVGGPWTVFVLGGADAPINYGVAPNPYFDGGTPAMSSGSWNLGISPATDVMDAAKKFVEFASLDPEGNALSAQESIIAPTNVDSFEAYIEKLDGFAPPSTEGMGQLTVEELQNAAVSRPNTIGFTQMQDVLDRAFSDIRNGQDVGTTLENAQAELQALWDRL